MPCGEWAGVKTEPLTVDCADQQDSARPQCPLGFLKEFSRFGEVINRFEKQDGVEAALLEGQILSIKFQDLDGAVIGIVLCGEAEAVLIDVAADDMPPKRAGVGLQLSLRQRRSLPDHGQPLGSLMAEPL